MEGNIKRYTIKWIKGYPYIYVWVYKSSESVSLRRETAMRNKKKYSKSREAWQKASSYYKWYSVGRGDYIINLSNDNEIDLYIEEKIDNAVKRLKRKYCGEDLNGEIDKIIEFWQQARIFIKESKDEIKREIDSITQSD